MTITACTLDCPDACSLLVENGPAGLRLRGNPAHPFTQGFACPKLDVLRRRLISPQRLRYPRLKVRGVWRDISWDEAFALCVEKITRYRADPLSILHMRGLGNRGVVNFLSSMFFRSLGASGLHGSLCDETGIAACVADFGCLRHNEFTDILNTAALMNWGRDFSRCSVHTAALVRRLRKAGAPVITIAPGEDTAQGYSDHFIRIRPGTDRFLAVAVLREILGRQSVSPRIAACCRDFSAFRALLQSTPADVLRCCGVGVDDVRFLADWYGGEKPVATILGWGLQRYRFGGQNVRYINALAMLGGHVGRSGGGAYYNISSMGNFQLGWKETTTYGRTLSMPRLARDLGQATPPVKMAWIESLNPANQFPEARAVANALGALDFVVVCDAFMTDTADVADLVLPVALMLEQEDMVGSCLHEYIQICRKVLEPPDGVRTDYEILCELGQRLKPSVLLPQPEEALRQAFASSTLAGSLDTLRETGYLRTKHAPIAFADLRFGHADGLYHFPSRLDPSSPLPAAYPLHLLTLVNRKAIHSQMLPEDHPSCPTVQVHPETLLSFGIRPGAGRLVTELGALDVLVEADAGVHPQSVIYRRGLWGKFGGGINRIIRAVDTDMGGGTAFYEACCRLERRQ